MIKLKLILLIFILIFTTGCWDRLELNDRAFVITLGIDKYKDEKEENRKDEKDNEDKNEKSSPVVEANEAANPNYIVSLSLPNLASFSQNAGGEDDGAKAKSIKKASASSVYSAIRTIDSYSSQSMFFGHTKAVVIGSDLLNDKKLFKGMLDALERTEDISRKIIILATDGTAMDVLEAQTPGEPLEGLFISKFFKNNDGLVAQTFKLDLKTLLQQLRSNSSAIIPAIKLSDKELVLEGAAIISNFKLVDFISPVETRGYLWLSGKATGAQVSADVDGISVPFSVRENKTQLSFSEIDNQLNLDINIYCDGTIEEYTLDDTLYSEEKIIELQKKLAVSIQRESIDFLNKLLKDLKVDTLDLKELLKNKNYQLWKKYEQNWNDIYSNELKMNITTEAKIRNIGVVK